MIFKGYCFHCLYECTVYECKFSSSYLTYDAMRSKHALVSSARCLCLKVDIMKIAQIPSSAPSLITNSFYFGKHSYF